MGCYFSKKYENYWKNDYKYSVKVSAKLPGETEIYRHKYTAQNGIINDFQKFGVTCNTIQESLVNSVKRNPDTNFVGKIVDNKVVFKTYKQIYDISEAVGSAILTLNLAPEVCEYKNFKLRLVGIFSKNREEWLEVDLANILYKAVTVSLYDTLGQESISYVINHSGIQVCFCNNDAVNTLLKTENIGKLNTIVAYDEFTNEQLEKAQSRKIKLYGWKDFLTIGQKSIQPLIKCDPDDIYSFSYTSGTTGLPKGAMITHRNMTSMAGQVERSSIQVLPTDLYLSFLPLPHILERICVLQSLAVGSSLCFYSGDIRRIKEDLAIVKPTFFVGVPRIFNRFYSAMQDTIQKQSPFVKFLINLGIKQKLKNAQECGAVKHDFWDKIVFKKMIAIMGGRCRFMLTGGAPLSGEVRNFLRIALATNFIEGYGQTESMGGAITTAQIDTTPGHVGGPMLGLEFKLVDVPEMQYTSEDKDENGNPVQRGELCLRGPQRFLGYYKDEEKTKEAIDQDGWLHTGDVAEIFQSGQFKIIDRKKNLFKLQQGEYVAPEKVENVYTKMNGVAEVFVHGDPLQNYCIGIIVPNPEQLINIAKKNNINGTFEELCKKPHMNQIMLKDLQALGKQEGLYGFEQVSKIYLEPVSFVTQGITTPTQKVIRYQAVKKYAQVIQDLYKNSDDQ